MRELRERAGPVLKIICLILAMLVVLKLAGIFVRLNPFRGVIVPALPTLAVVTNQPAGGSQGTNPARPPETNSAPAVTSATNSTSPATISKKGTNISAATEPTKTETNQVADLETKLSGTNSAPATNRPVAAETNASPGQKPEMKIATAGPVPGMAGMSFNGVHPPGKPGADLPPVTRAQVDRITSSEVLGPVMHPLPMALLGIAGEDAFIRTATGQTGLVKAGDLLGDLKLLRIGINRVLVEENGEKKELTIFSGYGGESLLTNDTSNENKHP
jgi:hypothetical protein